MRKREVLQAEGKACVKGSETGAWGGWGPECSGVSWGYTNQPCGPYQGVCLDPRPMGSHGEFSAKEGHDQI